MLELMYITNNPKVAVIAQKYGVDRIWIDLETLHKDERQQNLDTVKSHHTIEDIPLIRNVLNKSKLQVRINPINENSRVEIDRVLSYNIDFIMLPMWKSLSDVKKFLQLVNGRAKTILLLETKEAVECIDEVLANGGMDEIHIGLNDLHLSYGLNFMFELLSNGMVEMLCKKIAANNISYGFGGIARIGEGLLPAEKIIIEHYRLGSTRAILSRSFCNSTDGNIKEIETIFNENMHKLREFEKTIASYDKEDYNNNKQELDACVKKVKELMASRRK